MNFYFSLFRFPFLKWHLNTGPFGDWKISDHLNFRLFRYSDPHCATITDWKKDVEGDNYQRNFQLEYCSCLSQDGNQPHHGALLVAVLHWPLLLLMMTQWLALFSVGPIRFQPAFRLRNGFHPLRKTQIFRILFSEIFCRWPGVRGIGVFACRTWNISNSC